MTAARELHARLTKPAGSLGELEGLSIRLAGLAGTCPPPIPERPAVAVFAGDHGVHAQRVTPWPQEVTAQMVANFLAGGAVVNAFAREARTGATRSGYWPRSVAGSTPPSPGSSSVRPPVGYRSSSTVSSPCPVPWRPPHSRPTPWAR